MFFAIQSSSAPLDTPAAAAGGARAALHACTPALTASPTAPETCEVPLFTATVVPCDVEPPPESEAATVSDVLEKLRLTANSVEVSRSYTDPESACAQFFALHSLAEVLRNPGRPQTPESHTVEAAAKEAEAAKAAGLLVDSLTARRLLQLVENKKLLKLLQQLTVVPMQWGDLLFGLSDAKVLMALEGSVAVVHCSKYKYVEVRSHVTVLTMLT